MDVDLLAGIALSDLQRAVGWFDRFFGGSESFDPNDAERFWTVSKHRHLYVVLKLEHTGHAMVTLFVSDFDAFVDAVAQRGIRPESRETYGNGVRKAIYRDPDGNEVGGGRPQRSAYARAASMPRSSSTATSAWAGASSAPPGSCRRSRAAAATRRASPTSRTGASPASSPARACVAAASPMPRSAGRWPRSPARRRHGRGLPRGDRRSHGVGVVPAHRSDGRLREPRLHAYPADLPAPLGRHPHGRPGLRCNRGPGC